MIHLQILKKTNFTITIRYEIPTLSMVVPFFRGAEGVYKFSARSWNFRDFFNWGRPLQNDKPCEFYILISYISKLSVTHWPGIDCAI